MKRRVFLAQVNNRYGSNAFLPYSVGLLRAYAEKFPEIKEHYDFKGYLYLREHIPDVIEKLRQDPPDVVGISCYIWNFNYSMAFAKAVQEEFPDCLIVAGGPHIPVKSENFFKEHPYVDIVVHYEGEVTFKEILLERLKPNPQYSEVEGLSFKLWDFTAVKTANRERISDLDEIPSPYLEGCFDELMENTTLDHHASYESDRGCPYSCTFCISGDAVVVTLKGPKLLQEVSTKDSVLGWDYIKDGPVWGQIGFIQSRGVQPVVTIQLGDINVEATEDHKFYTKQGWKEAKEIQISDQILCCVRVVLSDKNSTGNGEKVLFQSLLGDFKRTQRERQQGSRGGELRRSPRGNVKEDDSKQPNEKIGSCPESISKGKRELCDRADSSVYVYRKGEKDNRSHCEKEAVKQCKPNEESSDCCRSGCVEQGEGDLRKVIRKDDSEQSYAKQNLTKEGCGCVEGSNYQREVGEELCRWDEIASEQIRAACNSVYEGTRSPVQIYGRSYNLDSSCRESFEQESRFYSYSERDKEGGVSTWKILAPGFGESGRGNSVVQESKMGSVYNLGGRHFNAQPSESVVEIRWMFVDSVKQAGTRLVYDLVNVLPSHNFFADGVLVSNCDWGSNTLAKLKTYSEDRLVQELEWFGKNRIDLLYGCNANFGIFQRDVELTQRMSETKVKYGFPNKFRTAYAKNSTERVYDIAKILHNAGMNKGVTLSFQSMDDGVLTAVKRKNIKMDNFKELMSRYRREGIATYSEIIIGLPEETYDTFADGIDRLLTGGQHDSLSVYTCEILPNAEMGDPAYQQKYGIKTQKVPVLFFHGTPSEDPHQETYELVVETNTLPANDWMKCQMFSWIVQGFHCLGLTKGIAAFLYATQGISYRKFYERLLKFMLKQRTEVGEESVLAQVWWKATWCYINLRQGKDWGVVDQRFGDIVWPVEEWAFLHCTTTPHRFYSELCQFLGNELGVDYELAFFLTTTQQYLARLPSPQFQYFVCRYNVPEIMKAALDGVQSPPLEEKFTAYDLIDTKHYDDLKEYAKEVVWYGRKGGKFMNDFKVKESAVV